MTRFTTHHDWPVQQPGDTDYEDTFDSLVDALDVDVSLRGTYADRPAAGTADRLYFAVDQHTIYYDDGNGWNAIGGFDLDGEDLVDGATVIWDSTNAHIPQGRLQNDSVTIAGNTVALGGSVTPTLDDFGTPTSSISLGGYDLLNVDAITTGGTQVYLWDTTNNRAILVASDGGDVDVPYGTLQQGGTAVALTSRFPLPNSDLANSTVTVAGNNVGLGGSTGVALGDLSNVTATGEGSGGGFNADQVDGKDELDLKQQQPNAHLPTTELADTDYAAIPIHIPANQTLDVFVWGARTDAQGTPVGLTVELYDETGAVSVLSQNTAHNTGNPIASLSAGSTSSDATLRLNNGTGGTVNAGAKFAYTVS